MAPAKPNLYAETLLRAGFWLAAEWHIDQDDGLRLNNKLSNDVGVYAFVKDAMVVYVGVATMGLAKRLYFYGRPGASQRTSLRLNGVIRNELTAGASIQVLVATPDDQQWHGLPVHGAAGLELGLIKAFDLPWNMRSAR
jgi:hypothetical protein